ncbi:MAG: FG-GAP repeat protein [Planctomycetes bacterium]|nr:FG-GAP repeat protein [Planctomycetota bacterium]
MNTRTSARLAARAATLTIAAFPLAAQCQFELAKLLPPTSMPTAEFGHDVAISGNRVVVGAPLHDDQGLSNAGSVHVYEPVNGAWSHVASITPFDPRSNDRFGTAVALDGDTIAVGSPYDDDNGSSSGSVYVYEFDGASWQLATKLTGFGVAEHFGAAVAIHGDVLAVGSPEAQGSQAVREGVVRVYERLQGVWTYRAIVSLHGTTSDVGFGASLEVHDEVIIAGAPGSAISGTPDSGAAYLIERVGSSWNETTAFFDPFGNTGDRFGESVSIFQKTAAVMAPNRNGGNGVGFVYRFDGAGWRATRSSSSSQTVVHYGRSVALSSNAVLSGDPLAHYGGHVPQTGGGYVRYWALGLWRDAAHADSPNSSDGDRVGYSCDLDTRFGVLGAPGDDTRGSDAGAAYVWEFPCHGYTLDPIAPAIAGQNNTIRIRRAIRQFSLVLVGLQPGYVSIPGFGPTQGVAIADLAILLTLDRTANPAMTVNLPVPAELSGWTVLVQAMELETEAISNLERVTFQ